MKALFVRPNKDSFGFKPIGLSLLSGIARNLGWDTMLFDTTEIDFGFTDRRQYGLQSKIFKPVDLSKYGHQKKKIDLQARFIKALEAFTPDCLAFSVLSDEFLIAAEISSIAKKVNPKLPIIWGGKYPTLNPEKTLKEFQVDFVCIGEGIEAFKDFLKTLSGRGNLFAIPNIYAKKDKSIIKNDIRPLKENLDDLPYVDWEIFDKREFYKPFDGEVYISGDHMLNWGCPYHCTYCINHFYHELYKNKYIMRRYSIERIIRELKYLKKKYSLEFFKFHDEDFLMRSIGNLEELSDAYRREINIPFVIETNPKSVTEKKIKLLKNMNCVSASIAIETGDPHLRKNLLKRVDSEEDIVRVFSLFKKYNIRTASFNLLGIPFESRDTYRKTVELNKIANVQYPNISFFYPFEGTLLREVSVKEGFFNPDNKDTIVYQRDNPALNFVSLSAKELLEMRNVFVLYVKLPKDYERFIRRSEKQDELGVKLRKKLSEIYDKTVWNNNGWYNDGGLKNTYLRELNELMSKYIEQKDCTIEKP